MEKFVIFVMVKVETMMQDSTAAHSNYTVAFNK